MRTSRAPLGLEVAIVALSCSVVFSFSRLFKGTEPLLALTAAVVTGHACSAATRRAGLGLLSSAAVTTCALALFGTWGWYWSTTVLALPTGETVSAVTGDLRDAWQLFGEVIAPAPGTRGFVVLSAGAFCFAAFLADWAAFRVRSHLEAIAPSAILFIFAALLGNGAHRVAVAIGYATAVFGYLLAARVLLQQRNEHWQLGSAGRGAASLARTGVALAVSALVVAAVLAPRLPGATAPALVSWQGVREQPGTRVTVSPLVDIQARLVSQSQVEVMTVRSEVRSYWRLTSLDTFDGSIWKSGGRYGEASGALPRTLAADVATATASQSFEIDALQQLWLPAAYEPRSVDAEGTGVRYESSSGTLIVDTAAANSDGLRYEVVSELPRFDPTALRAAGNEIPNEIAERYLDLPAGFSPSAQRAAREAVGAASHPYDQALALQSWFRDNFTYDLDIVAGHGEPAIERFLRERRGYCEQFSGAYAAMARSLGIPARVAVGFTPGEPSRTDPNLYIVRGEHAHAWPEVWLDGAGWVAMEPTPGRGAPGAEAWTGVAEQQDGSGPVAPPTSLNVTPTTTSDTQDPLAVPTTVGPADAQPATAVSTDDQRDTGFALNDGVTRLVIGALVVALSWATVLPVALLARRRRRRRRARRPGAYLQVLWTEAQEELASIGALRHPSETRREFAERAAHLITGIGRPLAQLAEIADRAEFALLDEEAHLPLAQTALSQIRSQVAHRLRPARRVTRWMDPTPLIPTARRRTIGTRLLDDGIN